MVQKKKSSVKSQPMICVKNVEKSSSWYQKVLGCKSGHGGDEYEMLMSGKTLILQLHAWDAHEHKTFGKPSKSVGNGMVLWFHVDDFDSRVKVIKKQKAKIVEDAHENPLAYHREIWIRDLDGYLVVISGK